ncbi:hypothetical protein QP463_02260 [Actinotignum schaalii]|nr:hypothetical protein [Actinotignum schaalii]
MGNRPVYGMAILVNLRSRELGSEFALADSSVIDAAGAPSGGLL